MATPVPRLRAGLALAILTDASPGLRLLPLPPKATLRTPPKRRGKQVKRGSTEGEIRFSTQSPACHVKCWKPTLSAEVKVEGSDSRILR